MYLAKFRTTSGSVSLPIDRATVLEGFRLHGYTGPHAVRAMNNLSRGVPVIVGECAVERVAPKSPRGN